MRQITLSTKDYPTEAKALIHLQEHVLRINSSKVFRAHIVPTLGLAIDRFVKEEQIEEIVKTKPGEAAIEGLAFTTATGYRYFFNKHIRPKWGNTPLEELKPLAVTEWLKSLPLAPKTRGHIRGLLHLLLERAMLWGLMDVQRNPIELVVVKGVSRRQKRPYPLTPAQFQQLIAKLDDPCRTIVITAMCTGLRISEILALRIESIDLSNSVMLVRQGVVHGRVGKVKTEASQDEVPLDSAFVAVLKAWMGDRTEGLLFPSPKTGLCYHAAPLQQKYLLPAGKELGIPRLGFHAFRHAYRALLDETGAPIGVQQKLMRHANVATTMNIYGSSTIAAKRNANSKVVQMVLTAA
jgi:integrase